MKHLAQHFCAILLLVNSPASADLTEMSDAQRLYEDLMREYNPLARPVGNFSEALVLKMGLQLSQIIDINLKSQILSTIVWVKHEWTDWNLKWDPEEYRGISKLHIPAEDLWLPDTVLYNNADGDYHITKTTKATVYSDGRVKWRPPAIYKSSCTIDVEYFPFDEQTCYLRLGTWAYDGLTIDLQHIQDPKADLIEVGIDLTKFYPSSEWDVISVPAEKRTMIYACCSSPYQDIVFQLTIRRKTLFYTVNLIIPCVAISFLCILVFHLPSDSGEKISLSISIMLTLVVFFLLLSEILPPTSIGIPLLGRYLIFTLVLVTLSVCLTILVLNISFRSPSTHRMAPWVKRVFIQFLPRLLCMRRPEKNKDCSRLPTHFGIYKSSEHTASPLEEEINGDCMVNSGDKNVLPDNMSLHCMQSSPLNLPAPPASASLDAGNSKFNSHFAGDLGYPNNNSFLPQPNGRSNSQKTLLSIQFVAQHMENMDNYHEVVEDWKYVALVMDRLFLVIFSVSCVVGTVAIIGMAPSLYDTRPPIDLLLSKYAKKTRFWNG